MKKRKKEKAMDRSNTIIKSFDMFQKPDICKSLLLIVA